MPTADLVHWMDAHLYPEHASHWDDVLFREAVLSLLGPGRRLLDLGAGAGIVREMDFRGHAAEVCGLDPDPRVLDNPHLDRARVGTGEAIPWEDGSFDVVVADNVLEHLEDPVAVFREVARVLRPGGRFLAKTPNRRHYVPTVARLTPHSFHRAVNRARGRRGEDTFPTRYRANTPGTLRVLAEASGLRLTDVRLVEGRPEYLRTNPLLYAFGWGYERLVNRFESLAPFRVLLVATFEKPAG